MTIEVNNDNYYSNTGHLSVSQYKAMLKCQGGRQEDTEKSTALLVGSYVDSYIEGTLEEFKRENPQIFLTRGENKGELKSEFKIANKVCEFLDNDEVCKQFLSGEKQTIMTGEIEGVPFKIKMDSYIPEVAIVDLKVMATIRGKNGKLYNFIEHWGYDIQLACYQEIVRQNTGERLPCYILVCTKENPIECRIISISQFRLDMALEKVKSNIKEIYDVFMGKIEPKYCGKCPNCIKNGRYDKIISIEDLEEFVEY